MSSQFFISKRTYNKYAHLCYQQELIEKAYDFFDCRIIRNVLTCTGSIQPDNCNSIYKVKIECVAGLEPKTTILSPYIEPSVKIHMYKDHSLCLHYPPDMKWGVQTMIYMYTIPWISEWIIFYELYLVNGGKWLGRESPTHITERDKNKNTDTD